MLSDVVKDLALPTTNVKVLSPLKTFWEKATLIHVECHRQPAQLIPNYGEKWCHGENISTGFVESTINEVAAKRMVNG